MYISTMRTRLPTTITKALQLQKLNLLKLTTRKLHSGEEETNHNPRKIKRRWFTSLKRNQSSKHPQVKQLKVKKLLKLKIRLSEF